MYNKLAADSEMPATEELVGSNASLFLSSSKHRNVIGFEEHTDKPLDMKTRRILKTIFKWEKVAI